MMSFVCSECGALISDETIEKSIQYAHDCGFDEGYETAIEELRNDFSNTRTGESDERFA